MVRTAPESTFQPEVGVPIPNANGTMIMRTPKNKKAKNKPLYLANKVFIKFIISLLTTYLYVTLILAKLALIRNLETKKHAKLNWQYNYF